MASVSNLQEAIEYARVECNVQRIKEKQLEVLSHSANGHDTLVVLPTGYGKSLCYQLLPIVYDYMRGWTDSSRHSIGIVVSPLVALMEDQVRAAREKNVESVFIGEGVDKVVKRKVYDGAYSLVFGSPEALLYKPWKDMLFSDIYQRHVCFIAVDEAHCIRKWGPEFRPEYNKLDLLRSIFPNVPVMALTATATRTTCAEILRRLSMTDVKKVAIKPDRPNVKLCVEYRRAALNSMFGKIVDELKEKGQGTDLRIIYSSSLARCETLITYLMDALGDRIYLENKPHEPANMLVGLYHRGAAQTTKTRILQSLQCGNNGIKRVIIATVSLGMGIDNPFIKEVIHFGCPSEIESYAQEIGRAGRDPSLKCKAVMFVNGQDTTRKNVTNDMKLYCQNKSECRRKVLLGYFNSSCTTFEPPHDCCDVCEISCKCKLCVRDSQYDNDSKDGSVPSECQAVRVRHSTDEQREEVEIRLEALRLVYADNHGVSFVGSHEFTTGLTADLVNQVVERCDFVKDMHTLRTECQIWSTQQGLEILQVLSSVFNDITAANPSENLKVQEKISVTDTLCVGDSVTTPTSDSNDSSDEWIDIYSDENITDEEIMAIVSNRVQNDMTGISLLDENEFVSETEI
ncbi:ATP-dependent DNA helicase RecQ-like [Glandiceps talaboti]